MTTVSEYGFELGGVPFGIGQTITVEDEGFDPGSDEWNIQDSDDPRTGHTAFGRDALQGPTWAWVLSTDMESAEEALLERGKHKVAWRAREIRQTPGAVTYVRYNIGGRTRRVYGRPRRWASPPSNRIISGYVPITCDFKCVDGLHYDDLATSVVIDLAPDSTEGGFVLPAQLPIVTIPSSVREGIITVGGDALAYPVIRIDGPVNGCWVEGLDWRLDLNLNLTEGQYVTIDTHPWANSVLRNGTSNVAGALGRKQWLSRVRLTPGQQEIRFGGQSLTNLAKATVTWRAAWEDL